MSYPPDPNNPYAKPQEPAQPGYGYPQQPPAPAQAPYGYPQPPQQQDPYAQQPPGYGYPQQPPAYGFPQQQAGPYGNPAYAGYGGGSPYAGWGARLGAYIIDGLIAGLIPFIIYIIAGVAFASSVHISYDVNGNPTTTTSGGSAGIAVVLYLVAAVIGLAGTLWICYREGTTGQSPGKKALNIRLVRESDGQPIGFGLAFVRKIAHILDAIPCYVGFLWPLWDDKKQCFADKVMSTVVVKTQ